MKEILPAAVFVLQSLYLKNVVLKGQKRAVQAMQLEDQSKAMD